ncbi:MAG: hypothetical protein SOV55_06425 [Candidatus Borkfalkiaceae bacterium]|nr:hypothetical protein [Christensenellaceae bacterium]
MMIKKIFLSIFSVLLAFSVGAMLYVNVSFADDGYLFNGDTEAISATYVGTGKSSVDTKATAPDGLTGNSYAYTNYNAPNTYAYVSKAQKNTLGDGAYNAIRIIAKFDTNMQPETLQFGLFNLEEALSGEELKNSCIMDAAGIRWEKSAGNASDITVGWNVITLPLDDLNAYGGFARNSYVITNEARTKMDAFAIRAFGGGSVFEVDIYSVELVTLSATVKAGVTAYGKSEGTKVEDVVPTVASWEDLNKSTAEIDGVTYDTYGSVGWGGYAKKILFDKPYDVSKINATGKGALTLFFYMDNEDLLAKYTESANNGKSWNIDVYGSDAYSDALKLSYNINVLFKDVVCGWNKIILPFGAADEKNNMNFETVYGIRLNCIAFEVNSGNTVSVAGIKFAVTDYAEKTVVTDIKDVAFGLSDAGDGLTVENAEVDGHSFDVVYVNGWGGYVRVLTLDGAYDVSALKNSGRGALALRFYIKDEASLNVYKGLTTYNLDVCSADSYNDNNKASFNISAAFSMCQVGWNRILIPLSAGIIDAGGSVDWSSIKNIRINNSQGGGTPTFTAFGDIQVVLSDVEELTVEGYVPPEPEPDNHREACEADSGLHIESFDEPFGDGQKETRAGFVKQGEASMSLTGMGTAGTAKKLAYAYDLSSYDKISFNLYVDDAEAFLAMADGQLEMTSSGTNDDKNEINWKLKNLKLKDGWNYVVLDMADAEKTGAVDVTKINYIRFYFVGLSKTVTTVFDDLHAHKSEGVVIEGFDGSFNGYIENVAGKVGNALNMSGDGWIERKKYAEPVDISDADKIAIWINCLDESTCKQIAGTEMEISSSGTCDKNELTFHFPNDLKVGWNHLVFDIKTATRTGGECDLTKVNFVGFIKPGLNKIGVYFDDLRAIESKFVLAEETVKIDKKIILPCDKVVDGVFDGLTVDDENAKEGVASLTTNGQNQNEILSASFNVKTGLSLKGENELGYTFWFYVEKAENLSSLSVELSSSANCDEFELQWDLDLSGITDGWNWITLKASDAQKVGGVIDLDNIVRTRLIIFGKDGTKNLIKLDCFQIVDATLDGAFDKVETVVVLNPVTAVDANDCEQAWENGSVDETNKKEGYSSISVKGNGNATVTAKGTANVGKTDLLVANYKKSNKLGVSFWLYVASMEDVESVAFALTAGSGKIAWNVTNLETGWNWVVLSVSDENVTVTGNADADNITAAELTVNAAANEGTYKNFAVNIDRVKVINAAVEENYTEPADESKQRNYVKELVIIDCNSTSGTSFSGNKVDKEDFRYGNGSVYTSGSGYALNAIDLEIGKTDLTKDTFVLAFWIWIEDPALYVDGVDGQVEISSSNEYDKREINWDFVKVAKNLEKGWNWVVFKGSEAVVSDGTLPDFDNLCRFRIYVNNIAASTMKIDRITIGYIGNEKLFAAPDFENEKDNSGTFKGPNGKVAENGTYIEVDFEEAEGFTVLEAEGCGSEAGAECGIVAALALVAAIVLKKRNQKAIR